MSILTRLRFFRPGLLSPHLLAISRRFLNSTGAAFTIRITRPELQFRSATRRDIISQRSTLQLGAAHTQYPIPTNEASILFGCEARHHHPYSLALFGPLFTSTCAPHTFIMHAFLSKRSLNSVWPRDAISSSILLHWSSHHHRACRVTIAVVFELHPVRRLFIGNSISSLCNAQPPTVNVRSPPGSSNHHSSSSARLAFVLLSAQYYNVSRDPLST
ncbi:hypothetical protein B0H16DRAFT_929691 [Mycena metata]|uniref:Uncharacterized protein n=1 Tax=Mycena metata TaxID=1033252 RepID=A0AAD7IRL2_9AGAR|nr:hypothetical protein B0H16DRAFT_929691 [Mycena metata]